MAAAATLLGAAALWAADPGGAGAESGSPVASLTVPVTPFRILDTRTGVGTGGPGVLGPDATITLQVAGVGGVPAEATAVVVNLTVTGGDETSWVTAYPTGAARPEASVANITTRG